MAADWIVKCREKGSDQNKEKSVTVSGTLVDEDAVKAHFEAHMPSVEFISAERKGDER